MTERFWCIWPDMRKWMYWSCIQPQTSQISPVRSRKRRWPQLEPFRSGRVHIHYLSNKGCMITLKHLCFVVAQYCIIIVMNKCHQVISDSWRPFFLSSVWVIRLLKWLVHNSSDCIHPSCCWSSFFFFLSTLPSIMVYSSVLVLFRICLKLNIPSLVVWASR